MCQSTNSLLLSYCPVSSIAPLFPAKATYPTWEEEGGGGGRYIHPSPRMFGGGGKAGIPKWTPQRRHHTTTRANKKADLEARAKFLCFSFFLGNPYPGRGASPWGLWPLPLASPRASSGPEGLPPSHVPLLAKVKLKSGRLNANQPVVARHDPTWIPVVDKAPWTNSVWCSFLVGMLRGTRVGPQLAANLTIPSG